MVPASYYVLLSAAVFSIGVYGVLTRTNAIVILMSVELMLNAGNINLVAFSSQLGDMSGQVFALFSLTVAAAEVAVGLGIFIVMYRSFDTVDVTKPSVMRW
ncbi:MAG: NADH-quinone oxidoreductase subunit NuoK [Halobacteria archaeon]|nr:NADH-quinone oxidoreductase subunit NuoK [Halobacteria archaeon]